MASFMKTVAIDQLSTTGIIVMLFGVMLFCLTFAWLIEILVPDISFGFGINTFLLFSFLWGGLFVYGRYIGMVKYNPAMINIAIAVGSALTGMFVLCLIKSRPFSRG